MAQNNGIIALNSKSTRKRFKFVHMSNSLDFGRPETVSGTNSPGQEELPRSNVRPLGTQRRRLGPSIANTVREYNRVSVNVPDPQSPGEKKLIPR